MIDPAPAPSAITTSYARDIHPMFTDLDIQKMAWAFDLAAYADVKANASKILYPGHRWRGDAAASAEGRRTLVQHTSRSFQEMGG
jgi:hypothetical protein